MPPSDSRTFYKALRQNHRAIADALRERARARYPESQAGNSRSQKLSNTAYTILFPAATWRETRTLRNVAHHLSRGYFADNLPYWEDEEWRASLWRSHIHIAETLEAWAELRFRDTFIMSLLNQEPDTHQTTLCSVARHLRSGYFMPK